VLSIPSFRRLWAALGLSLVGDFFSYIAVAWLVLQITGSSLALGSVLLVQALPRAALMLVGGVVVDRLSARVAMLASMGLRICLVAPLAGLVLAGLVQLWEVYAISFVFGVVDAFFLPARTSILPRLVADHQLEAGNAVLNTTQQAATIAGPALGGLTVAALGTGWAFASDAACFALGLLFVLWLPASRGAGSGPASLASSFRAHAAAGFRYAWADVGIRASLIIIAVVDFAATGALGVGLATLAHQRFGTGAAGFGFLFVAWGVGATLGAAGAGMVPPPKRYGLLLVGVCAWIGAGLAVVGLLPTLLLAGIAVGVAGIASGVINTYGVSWLQRRTAREMQGRVMSLVMFASVGLAPIAYAVSGAIAQLSPDVLFIASGTMILAAAAGAAASRVVRDL
jgi:MFS family permease